MTLKDVGTRLESETSRETIHGARSLALPLLPPPPGRHPLTFPAPEPRIST